MLKTPTRSRDRLTDISHYFLSEVGARPPIWQHTTVIPLLLGSRHDDYVVYALERAFEQQHRSCMVLNVENQPATAAAPALQPNTVAPQDDAEHSLPELALVPLTSTGTTLALQCERILIAVDSSLSGVRRAYEQLAFLASLETDLTVGIIMVNARRTGDAERFFRFLCDSSQSLLELSLECAGFLLDVDAERPTGQCPVATDIDGVASGILRALAPRSAVQDAGEPPPALDPASRVARLLS